MPATKQPSKIGKFSSSANSAPITQRQASLYKSLGRGPVTDQADIERPLSTIKPARTVSELQLQIGELIAAFQQAEGRDPDANDHGFWRAYSALMNAYAENQNIEPSKSSAWVDD